MRRSHLAVFTPGGLHTWRSAEEASASAHLVVSAPGRLHTWRSSHLTVALCASLQVFQLISDFSKGGVSAAERLQSALLQVASQLSEEGAAFLLGLLKAQESERIGAGAAGFLQIQLAILTRA